MKANFKCTLFFVFLCTINSLKSQDFYSFGFVTDTLTITKSNSKDVLSSIDIDVRIPNEERYKNYNYIVSVISNATTLSSDDYKIVDFSKKVSNTNKSENLYFLLKKDTLHDRERKIVLEIKIYDHGKEVTTNNLAKNQKITITIPIHQTHENLQSNYSYLSYVGTNFDLVDGIKAQNLFFATNILLAPRINKNKVGFYLSLYGNRAMRDVDSTGTTRRSYKLEKLTDSTYIDYTAQSKMTTNRVSDNIGAHISTLFRIFKSKERNDLNLYFSPTLEFVWRRTNLIQKFSDPKNLESTIVNDNIPGTIEFSDTAIRQFNEYSFNAGLFGLFLSLENEDVSVRIQGSFGYSSNYYPRTSINSMTMVTERSNDIFFAGRAWITEPKTGVTIQAEITNTKKNPRPFFGVTLSKAFNLKDLSGIFSPLTSRK